KGSADRVTHACAELLLERGAARDRLTPGVYGGRESEGMSRVERAFALVHEVAPLKDKTRKAGYGGDWAKATAAGVLTEGEAARLAEAMEAVRSAIRVDDFAPGEIALLGSVQPSGEPAWAT